MSLRLPTKIRTVFTLLVRSLCRIYFRPGWIEHGAHDTTMPSGLYITNYKSWIDPLLLMVLLEKEFRNTAPDFALAINIRHKKYWVSRWTEKLGNVIYFDPSRSDAPCNEALSDATQSERCVIIMPEGRPTDTGALLPICDVLATILSKTERELHPIYIDGTQCTRFSNEKPRQNRTALWPRVTLHLFPAQKLTLPDNLKARERTRKAADALYDILSQIAYEHYDYHCTLFRGILRAMHRQGGKHIIAEDVERNRLSYRKLVAGSYVLGKAIAKRLHKNEQTVGVMLPSVNGALVTFCGLQAYGRIPAMLNFTAGRRNICLAAKTASIHTVITSKRFVKISELEQTINALREQGQKILYLEDLRKEIGLFAKLAGLKRALRGFKGYESLHTETTLAFDSERPAVILFTSGSEGAPKGVALSHENLMANIAQLQSRIDFGIADCIFNPLPMFHTSGLTGGFILPLMSGMKMFLYPSPLHYQTIAELIADTQSTILFATDTFLNGYARYSHPYYLHRLRYVFAGAEKLRPETCRLWSDRFGVRIFEGYGATETAPILAFKTPMQFKPESVVRLAPGINHQLKPVEGIEKGGNLMVKAPNVMLGYLLLDNPENLVAPEEGWYDTGDIVDIDDEGFVHLIGRAKRFAKIGGEMVSLGGVEQYISKLWPDTFHAVISEPDSRKGEQLTLITTHADAERQEINGYFREQGIPELYVPRTLYIINELPVLGSGKTDYPALKDWVAEQKKPRAKTS
ncbi:MAG: AMP-binding protein [Alphaproteobacteria bacterium]|nr:AMP-binding protein [Alphaproteobacteria bacterium]